jgi:hypothetical protein
MCIGRKVTDLDSLKVLIHIKSHTALFLLQQHTYNQSFKHRGTTQKYCRRDCRFNMAVHIISSLQNMLHLLISAQYSQL